MDAIVCPIGQTQFSHNSEKDTINKTDHCSRLVIVIVIINVTLSITRLDDTSDSAIQSSVSGSVCGKDQQVRCV